MQLKLTDEEMQEVRKISERSSQSMEGLLERLELLSWGDGLLEFRMAYEILPWMEQLMDLSDRIHVRLRNSGIPFGPSPEAYQEWCALEELRKANKNTNPDSSSEV